MKQNNIFSLLTNQQFSKEENEEDYLQEFKQIAANQAKMDNSIAVLTDYSKNCSYIYSGNFGLLFGLNPGEEFISSAFEDIIFDKIDPIHFEERNLLEDEFFSFIRTIPLEDRSKYNSVSFLNIKKKDGEYLEVLHKTFFINSCSNGSVRVALCLYSPSAHKSLRNTIEGKIINNETAEVLFSLNETNNNLLLGKREEEVLKLIAKGFKSKDISNELNISVHTVYRHRQNIIEKLGVNNTTEAINKLKSQI